MPTRDRDEEANWFESGRNMWEQDLSETAYFEQTFSELSILKLAALISAGIGTSNRYELIGALLSHLIYSYGAGQKGVDGIFSFLGGSLLHKKKYALASLPLLSDVIDSVNELRKTKTLTTGAITKNGLFVLGFLSSQLKFV